MKNKLKKIATPIVTALLLTVILAYVLLATGSAIANNHTDLITNFLGQTNHTKVYANDAEEIDAEYFKSDFTSVREVKDSGIAYTQKMMEEGAVLLKNEVLKNGSRALPLNKNEKVSLFGVGSAKPTVSGYIEQDYKSEGAVSFLEGFKPYLTVNENLYDWYAKSSYGRFSIFGSNHGHGNIYGIGEAPWSALPSSKTEDGFKTAIFVISRISGEASDVQLRPLGEQQYGMDAKNGNYLALSENEEDVLSHLKEEKDRGTFEKIIVIMNVTNQVQCNFENEYGVDALLYMGSTGSAGTPAVGRLLIGEVNPSGKLSDTFWKNHLLNPVHANWGPAAFKKTGIGNDNYYGFKYTNMTTNLHSNTYTVYQEGIYSGYRYTETRYEDVALNTKDAGEFNYNDAVAYPFGYGLSYTSFVYSDLEVKENTVSDSYEVSVTVQNTGECKGKEAVQLFLQKPYTDYDKKNRVEKASVEFVDFAKTVELEKGGTCKVSMRVPKRDFASYDSYGAGSYIYEDGQYYLTVASDAHTAVNNILAQKAKTGVAVNADAVKGLNGERVQGDSSLVHSIKINENNQKKYAQSVTGKEIVNRFSDVDLKLYDAAGENSDKFEYITRKNWSGTVVLGFDENGNALLDNAVKLVLTDEMKAAMNETTKKNNDLDMPITGSTDTDWQLIDMRLDDEGKPLAFNDKKWEQFIDQLTIDELTTLLQGGLYYTPSLDSISLPRSTAHDSDLGVREPYGAFEDGLAAKLDDPNRNEHAAANPDNGIVASTRNKQLIREYGVQWGEDCLWAGYNGLYGTGCDTHRSPYGGRNYGYFSEDPILMGKCVSEMNIGMEEKGAFMLLKHCMLNEQETSRLGGSSWANEQTIREVYLRSFQIAVESGGVQGVMTSLNRLGVTPAPEHNFLNEVMRDEFGMNGFCVTDSWQGYMNVADCLIAGNDLPLEQRLYDFSKYKTYPNVIAAAKRSAHNILYAIVQSNAMNGIADGTRFITFMPEWQYYLNHAVQAMLVIMIVFAVIYAGFEVWKIIDGKLNQEENA